MRPSRLAVLMLLVSATASAANPLEIYRHMVGDAGGKKLNVQGYSLPAGMYYTHLVVGQSADTHIRLVLLHCDESQCEGTTHAVGDLGASIESLALVDLAGDATSLEGVRPSLRNDVVNLPWSNPRTSTQPAAIGALVVKTMHAEAATGTYRHGGDVQGMAYDGTIAILDITRLPMQPLLQRETLRRSAAGAGLATTYTFVRTRKHPLLDVRASEQKLLDYNSRCLPPDPITYLYTINNGRYTIAGERPLLGGC